MDEETIQKDYEVMTKVIGLAMAKGWRPIGVIGDNFKWSYRLGTFHMKTPIWDGEKMVEQMHSASIEKILFNHEFAICLWGESSVEVSGSYSIPEWQYQLKCLAVAEDRIEFLEKMDFSL